MPRIDNHRFYDPHFRGPLSAPPARLQGGWMDATAVPSGEFYRYPHPTRLPTLGRLLLRLVANPYAFGGALLLLGFTAVFLNQAPLLYQIVLGAPIFEESFKFGLALIIAYPLRLAALRLPVAWLVGAGFGWMEHHVSYSFESDLIYASRVVFHGGATMLSMASFHIIENAADVRARWASTLFATFLHYVNNSLAVVLAIPLAALPAGERIAIGVFLGMSLSVYVATIMVFAMAPALRDWVERVVRRRRNQAAAPGVLR